MRKRLQLPFLPVFDSSNKETVDIVIVALCQNMKSQMERGRPGPTILDYSTIYENLQNGRMVIKMVHGNPSYPELRFCP
jgi:hypothetical protein